MANRSGDDLASLASSLSACLYRPVNVVTSASSIEVAAYRMKKVRDHYVFSQLKKRMLDAKENWVVAITLRVVLRALRGNYAVLTILLTPEVVDLVKQDLKSHPVCGQVLLASNDVVNEILGSELNFSQACAAIVNVAPSCLCPQVETISRSAAHNKQQRQLQHCSVSDEKPTEEVEDERDFAAVACCGSHNLYLPSANDGDDNQPSTNGLITGYSHQTPSVQSHNVECRPNVTVECTRHYNQESLPRQLTDPKHQPLDPRLKLPLLVMDDVRSSDNIGSILRTAFSFGIPSLLCTQSTFSAVNARSARVSMGALFHLDVYVTSNLAMTIQHMKQNGICVVGTSPVATRFINPQADSKWALVIGNEDKGCSTETLESCSQIVSIPQVFGDSLSVVSASAICLYELSKNALTEQRTRHPEKFIPDLP